MDDAPLQYTKPSSSISEGSQLWPCSFPSGWGPHLSSKGASPAPPVARVPLLAHHPSLIYACLILLPSLS